MFAQKVLIGIEPVGGSSTLRNLTDHDKQKHDIPEHHGFSLEITGDTTCGIIRIKVASVGGEFDFP